jgi:hypothetical protein
MAVRCLNGITAEFENSSARIGSNAVADGKSVRDRAFPLRAQRRESVNSPQQIERRPLGYNDARPCPRRATNTLVWIDTFVQWIRRRASANLALNRHSL